MTRNILRQGPPNPERRQTGTLRLHQSRPRVGDHKPVRLMDNSCRLLQEISALSSIGKDAVIRYLGMYFRQRQRGRPSTRRRFDYLQEDLPETAGQFL